ncbi:hypothetical protein HU200_059060 [Digitaria exilis]|uniref:DUF6598 domain-containing protein n=1 Tax=Digitaria exilis TaxID=1010633 RepID=A0A835DZX2_9POAL|nr:hypothetical protein HU200_059060 [Digitaria exilis]CAB3468613.1 unnamed protein product [Digitaria exilis]
MSKVWDSNMHGTANDDGGGGEDNAKAILLDDCGDGPKDGSSSGSDHHDDHAMVWDNGYDEIESCARAVQLLAIRANFHVTAINAYNWNQCRSIYRELEGEDQEEGMDLVLTGPYRILEAYGSLGIKVFTPDCDGSSTDDEGYSDDEAYSTDDVRSLTDPLFEMWDVTEPELVEECTNTIFGSFGRMVEITYLVIPDAVETHVEVRLNLEDFGSRSRDVFGSVKASAVAYGSKSVHLFSCERRRSLSVPCGSTFILPLSPSMIALPCGRHFKLQIEVDLRVITTSENQEEDKNLKFCLDCSHRSRSEERLEFPLRIRSQKREFAGDQVEVNVTWRLER